MFYYYFFVIIFLLKYIFFFKGPLGAFVYFGETKEKKGAEVSPEMSS
jgi:hypothetical protein